MPHNSPLANNRKGIFTMKKITTMLIALTMAALTLTGCSNEEGSSSVTEQNVSGLTSENETFVTISTTEEVTEESEEEVIIHRSSPHIEELLVGILNAIGSHNEEEYNTYISPENRNHKRYSYEAVHGQFVEVLYNAGLDHKAIYTYEDFTAYKYFGYVMYFNENPDILFEIGSQVLDFDIETECYSIMGITFDMREDSFEYAKEDGTLLDLSTYATEVTE